MARLAVRAIALLTPDAMLTWSGLTDAMTVAVSGATNVTSPSRTRWRPAARPAPTTRRGRCGQQKQTGRDQQRTDRELQPRPDACASVARPGGEQQHQDRRREQTRCPLAVPTIQPPLGARRRSGRTTRRCGAYNKTVIRFVTVKSRLSNSDGRHERIVRMQHPVDERG